MIDINIDIFSIMIFLGLVQGLFLSILLLTRRILSHRMLGVILLVFSIQIFDFFSAYSLISLKYPHLIDISQPLGLFIGPLIYLLYLFLSNGKFLRKYFLHFIPAAIYLFNQTFYFLQTSNYKYNSFLKSRNINLSFKDVSHTSATDPLGLRNLGGELIAASLCIYSILVVIELAKIVKLNKKKLWRMKDSSQIFLRNFALIFILLVIYVLYSQLFIRDPKSEYIIATGLTLLIYYTSYHLTRNSFSFTKYEKSSLTGQLKEGIKNRLIEYMNKDKPYLSNVFSLKLLSKNISASPNYVSQIINEDFNQSYFDFIASYRIDEAKKYLLDPNYKNKNIEEISFLVGYNSKAAFNRAFKKFSGKPPLQYRKNQ